MFGTRTEGDAAAAKDVYKRQTLMSALVGTRRAVMRVFTSGRVAARATALTTANTANCTSHEEVNPETMSAATAPAANQMPVSYTHLDVYKRQR